MIAVVRGPGFKDAIWGVGTYEIGSKDDITVKDGHLVIQPTGREPRVSPSGRQMTKVEAIVINREAWTSVTVKSNTPLED